MFKVTGKQQYGAVWHEGKCIVVFRHGVALTNDPAAAKLLRELGYTVEGKQEGGEPPASSRSKKDA